MAEKIQKRNSKRKRKNRIRFVFLLLCGSYILCSILHLQPFAHGNVLFKKLFQTNYTAKYEIGTPRVIDESDISDCLYTLSKTYPEFKSIYENQDAYPKKLLSALCNNPEMIDFVKEYPKHKGKNTSNATLHSSDWNADGYPLLFQWDTRWGYHSFGDNNIGLSGCAPTCLSMVIIGLTKDKSATPEKVADYITNNGYYLKGTGTSWSVMSDGVADFHITGKEISLDETVIANILEKKQPIICSLRPGDFTTTGHFIVLTAYKDGKLQVHDPNSPYRSSKLWDYSQLQSQIKNLWSFSK